MNRAERRAGQRDGTVCEHGYVMKTDGAGVPLCPHRCGFGWLQPCDCDCHARLRLSLNCSACDGNHGKPS